MAMTDPAPTSGILSEAEAVALAVAVQRPHVPWRRPASDASMILSEVRVLKLAHCLLKVSPSEPTSNRAISPGSVHSRSQFWYLPAGDRPFRIRHLDY